MVIANKWLETHEIFELTSLIVQLISCQPLIVMRALVRQSLGKYESLAVEFCTYRTTADNT